MKDNRLDDLKRQYNNTPIPEELDDLVRKSIEESRKNINKKNKFKNQIRAISSIAAGVTILTIGVNVSPSLAQSLSKVPVINSVIKVLTFKEYKVDEEKFNADIKVPKIEGLENKELENSLNKKYLEENKKLYDTFMYDMEELKKSGGGHLGVDSGYEVKTDTDKILSIGRYEVNTVGSSSTTIKYDTIDKKRQVLITLPSLFKDERYINIISENIISQMKEEMKKDESKTYWIHTENDKEEVLAEAFEKIEKDQNFYINSDGKLVISFDKYDVAPGYMGTQEFVIPTKIISDILVSDEYIK